MAAVLVVHGTGKQYAGPRSLHGGVAPALLDGVRLAGGPPPAPEDVDLLLAWWREAAPLEPDTVSPPDGGTSKAAVPVSVQRALYALSRSRFVGRAGDRFLLGVLRQVSRYLGEPEVHAHVQDEVAAAVAADTRVLVGHSLGVDGARTVTDIAVDNGRQAHAVEHHLTAVETGTAIADGLRDGP